VTQLSPACDGHGLAPAGRRGLWSALRTLAAALQERVVIAALLAAVVATLINPYGVGRLLAITAALGLFAIRVSRIAAFFAIAAVFLTARVFSTEAASMRSAVPARYNVPRWSLAGSAIIMVMLMTGRTAGTPLRPAEWSPDAFLSCSQFCVLGATRSWTEFRIH
jgi:hypothetical protein